MEKENSNKINKCDTCSQKMMCEKWNTYKKITRRIRYLKYIIFGIAIVLGVLISGCDNLKCYPEYDPRGNYIGIRCGGNF